MRLIHKDQKGFTMLELLIALALTGLITTGITMIISQTLTGSARSSNHMSAVREVQEAGYWVSYYTYTAQDLTITGDSGFPLILQWVNFEPSERHKVVFSLNNTVLRGSYYVEDILYPVGTGKIPVFEFINPDKTKTNCQVSGGSAFSLPDSDDAFKITGGDVPDNGIITCTSGSISFTTTGSATCVPITGGWTWNTTATAGDTITATATSAVTKGSWTSETKAVTAAITVDSGATTATLNNANGLIFTVTATVGSGRQESSETRVYKVVPKPSS